MLGAAVETTGPPRAAGAGPTRLWTALARVPGALDGRRVGPTRFGNLWPAYVFALPFVARLWRWLDNLVHAGGAGTSVHQWAVLMQEMVTILFLGAVVVLFLVRSPVLGRRAGPGAGLVALAATFLLNLAGFLPVAEDLPTAAFVASTLVIVGGTVVAVWGLVVLGRCFGILPEARGLVTRGPYAWVRHPVYVGELVSGLGLIVVRPHVATLALYGVFLVLQYTRTVLEEDALARVFPDDYAAYRRRTGALLPRWRWGPRQRDGRPAVVAVSRGERSS